MDIWLTSFVGFAQFVLGVMGVYMALKPPIPKTHKRWITAFVVVSLLGLGATVWLAKRAYKSGEDQTKNMLGDQEHPPFVAVVSLPDLTRFVVTNNSDYPAYVTRIELRDDTAGDVARTVRIYGPRDFAAHTGMLDENAWLPPLNSNERHFTAEIATRNSVYYEV